MVPPSRLRELAREAAEKASIYEELQAHGSADLRSRLNATDGGAALPPVALSRIPFGPPPPPLPIPFCFGSGKGAHANLIPAASVVQSSDIYQRTYEHATGVSTERRRGSEAERLKAHRLQKKARMGSLNPFEREALVETERSKERLKKADQRNVAKRSQMPEYAKGL